MSEVVESAIGVEAVKVAMSQTKDGIKITLALHPNDDIHDLFSHPVGSRYQVALVLLDDENKPVPIKRKTDGARAVTAAVMLCKDSQFINWLHKKGYVIEPTEEAATIYLHKVCGIESRSELSSDANAREVFEIMRNRFMKDMGGFP